MPIEYLDRTSISLWRTKGSITAAVVAVRQGQSIRSAAKQFCHFQWLPARLVPILEHKHGQKSIGKSCRVRLDGIEVQTLSSKQKRRGERNYPVEVIFEFSQ